MNRREFAGIVGAGVVALGLPRVAGLRANHSAPQLAITMDDFSWANALKLNADERNNAILGTLRAHSLKAALFVRTSNIDNEKGKALLKAWDTAGHLIGN